MKHNDDETFWIGVTAVLFAVGALILVITGAVTALSGV